MNTLLQQKAEMVERQLRSRGIKGECLMHRSEVDPFMLPLCDKSKPIINKLEKIHFERAIGEINRSKTEL